MSPRPGSTRTAHVSAPTTAVVDLTPSELRHLAKPKEGFSPYVKPLVDMYVANKDDMPMKSFDAQELLTELDTVDQLTEQIDEMKQQLDLLVKTRALHASNAWRGSLRLYKWGALVGQTNAAVLRALSRFEQFMKKRVSRKKPTTGTPPATGSTPPTGNTPSGTGNGT